MVGCFIFVAVVLGYSNWNGLHLKKVLLLKFYIGSKTDLKNVRGCATGRKKIINWRKRSRELIATLKKNKNAKLTTHAHAKEKRGL